MFQENVWDEAFADYDRSPDRENGLFQKTAPGAVERFVYVFEGVNGRIKVGVSTVPDERVPGICSTFKIGGKMVFAAKTHAAFDVERTAHLILQQYGVGREWFDCSVSDAKWAVESAVKIING